MSIHDYFASIQHYRINSEAGSSIDVFVLDEVYLRKDREPSLKNEADHQQYQPKQTEKYFSVNCDAFAANTVQPPNQGLDLGFLRLVLDCNREDLETSITPNQNDWF